MNGLTLTDRFTAIPISLNESHPTLARLVDSIQQIEEVSNGSLIKWKTYDNQVVVRSPNYYYKIYQNDRTAGTFFAKVREKLAEIYREDYGIYWEIRTFEDKETPTYFQIEQREPLEVCTPDKITYEDLFVDWAKTLGKLEKKLHFKELTYQLQEEIEGLKEVKLVRDCVNKFEDYAFKNGHVILLDDSDWFLALIDKNNQWMRNINFSTIHVMLDSQDYMFAPFDFFKYKDLTPKLKDTTEKWNLFFLRHSEINKITKEFIPQIKSQHTKMLEDNIQVLSEKSIENVKKLYINTNTKCVGELLIPNYEPPKLNSPSFATQEFGKNSH